MIQYIVNQEERHRQKTFREEYIGMLEAHEIAYDQIGNAAGTQVQQQQQCFRCFEESRVHKSNNPLININ